MIFVTVGDQLPFDRLVRIVDEWAVTSGKEVFAQIGRTDWKPMHIAYKNFLTPEEFKVKLITSEAVIAHAGMGTIISALELGKPVLVMPRQADLGEVRNDHQHSTACRFLALNYISVAFDEAELKDKLDSLAKLVGHWKEGGAVRPKPSHLLIKTIRDFIEAK